MLASPRRATPLQRLFLVALSLLTACIAMETAYRVLLFTRLGAGLNHPSFRAVSASLYEFDAPNGYRYVPGRTATSVEIVNGRPARGVTTTVNRFGGLGPAPALDAPVKVLAFGDSFTSNPLQPVAWPEFVSAAPEFDVINCGRDGYGLIQMVHLAAEKSIEIRPDLVIVAFITEDLLRDRFWRSTVERSGGTSIFVSTTPVPQPDPSTAAELALVDPAITPEWFASLPADHPEQDPVFLRLAERFRAAARAFYTSHLRNPGRSLLLNRIRFGDPWHGLYPPARNPRTAMTSFADDPSFRADLAAIRMPLAFVLLPKYDELVAGHHFFDAQSEQLLGSLEQLTGAPVIRLMDYMNRDEGNLTRLFLLPDDQHPSPEGAAAYGEAVVKMLRERVKIVESDGPDGNR